MTVALAFRPTFDGSQNSALDPTMNVAGQALDRLTPAHFADGVSALVPEGVDAREVSNVVVGQGDPDAPNKQHVSELFTTMGQFIDHDLDLVPAGGAPIPITVPADDQHFAPGSLLPVTRAQVDPHTGAGTTHPAAAINSLSGWLDLSQVYGSSKAVDDGLRSHQGGHLLTSDGDNLPVIGGSITAGDVRATENDYLTSVQTLFLREHNRVADQQSKLHPDWTDDHLFDQARAVTTAEYQHIVYDEWLPILLGKGGVHPYHGYQPGVDGQVSEEFAGAAFRFGHTMVGDDIQHQANDGTVLSVKSLAEDFTDSPFNFTDFGGADAVLRAQSGETANVLDARIVDDLRNFLVDGGPPSDLAAINIHRGEDLGLGTLNQVRAALPGMDPYKTFEQITSDKATVAALKEAYHNDINAVDLWVGVVSEKPTAGGQIGQTGHAIIETTFEQLRDGDRFYFENQGFTKAEVKDIKDVSMADLIGMNTDTAVIQKDAFHAVDRGNLDHAKPSDVLHFTHPDDHPTQAAALQEVPDPLQALVLHPHDTTGILV